MCKTRTEIADVMMSLVPSTITTHVNSDTRSGVVCSRENPKFFRDVSPRTERCRQSFCETYTADHCDRVRFRAYSCALNTKRVLSGPKLVRSTGDAPETTVMRENAPGGGGGRFSFRERKGPEIDVRFDNADTSHTRR